MPLIGQPAPAFELPDQDGKPVALRDLSGRWVVLYFYPRDDTPGCTVEACEFTAARSAFAGLDAEVFGCSADGAASHQKFISKHSLGIRLLTDAEKATMRAYGAYGKKVMYGKQVEGVIRSTVLIDPAGNVAHHWSNVKAAGHAEAVRQKLQELQSGDVVIPAPRRTAASRPAKTVKTVKTLRTVKTVKPAKPAVAKPGRGGAKAIVKKKTAKAVAKVATRTGTKTVSVTKTKKIVRKAAAKPAARPAQRRGTSRR